MKQTVPVDPFERIASDINKGETHSEAAAILRIVADSIRQSYHDERTLMKRTDARDQYKAGHDATVRLLNDLINPAKLSWLERDNPIPDPGQLIQRLVDLKRRYQSAHDEIPTGGGKSRAIPRPKGFSPPEICALVIIELWFALRDTYPGARNAKATDAAQALCIASGGLEGTGAIWRRYFERMLRIPKSDKKRQTIAAIFAHLITPK